MKLFLATLISRNYHFSALGETENAAQAALLGALDQHSIDMRISKDWFKDMDITIDEMEIGHGYRDHSAIYKPKKTTDLTDWQAYRASRGGTF